MHKRLKTSLSGKLEVSFSTIVCKCFSGWFGLSLIFRKERSVLQIIHCLDDTTSCMHLIFLLVSIVEEEGRHVNGSLLSSSLLDCFTHYVMVWMDTEMYLAVDDGLS